MMPKVKLMLRMIKMIKIIRMKRLQLNQSRKPPLRRPPRRFKRKQRNQK